jgi:cytochrome subunit of sulfide dehydrogenase
MVTGVILASVAGCASSSKSKPAAKPATVSQPPVSAYSAANMGNNCFSCHGPEGRSPGTIPSLNGKSADFIASSMKEFRSGKKPSTVMGRHAKGYTDAEIDAIAIYLSSLK